MDTPTKPPPTPALMEMCRKKFEQLDITWEYATPQAWWDALSLFWLDGQWVLTEVIDGEHNAMLDDGPPLVFIPIAEYNGPLDFELNDGKKKSFIVTDHNYVAVYDYEV